MPVTDNEFKFPFHFVTQKESYVERHDYRKRLGEFLESTKFQYFIVALIVLDLIIVIVELFLEEHYKCLEHHEIPHSVEKAEDAFGITTLVILGIFEVEVLLLLIAFGKDFFKHPLYVFDAIVVTMSIIVETVFKDKVGALLVVFRLWRVVRIGHAIMVVTDTEGKKKAKEKKKKYYQKINEKEDEIKLLRDELHQLKVKYGESSVIMQSGTTSTTNSSPILNSEGSSTAIPDNRKVFLSDEDRNDNNDDDDDDDDDDDENEMDQV